MGGLAAHFAPEPWKNPPHQKIEGAGKAGRPPDPRPSAWKKHGERTTGLARSSGLPCAMVLRLVRDLPGDRACLPPSSATFVALRAWPERREARTTRLRLTQERRSSNAPSRPSHPASRFVTIAIRPSCRVGTGGPYFRFPELAWRRIRRLGRRGLRLHARWHGANGDTVTLIAFDQSVLRSE
jgi:hypothetical protein